MILGDLFKALSYGELSNLAMGESGVGLVRDSDKEKIVLAANDCLLDLYTRFPLSTKSVVIQTSELISVYYLNSQYAQSNVSSPEPIKYIRDSILYPFKDDVIRITNIHDEYHCYFSLNDVLSDMSIFTPSPTSIQITNPNTGLYYSIVYQAKHPQLDKTNELGNIYLVDSLHRALRCYIASSIYSSLNMEGALTKSKIYRDEYEFILNNSKIDNTLNTSIVTSQFKLHQRGWI